MGFWGKLFGGEGSSPAPAPQEAVKPQETGDAEKEFFGATMDQQVADQAALDKWKADQELAAAQKASTERDMLAAAEARRAAFEADAAQMDVNDADGEEQKVA